METFPIPEKKFGTPQEELAYLREEIARKDIRVGDWATIEKGGDVIPKVVSIDPKRRPHNSQPWHMPKTCPVCKSSVVHLPGEVAVRCQNAKCLGQRQRRILYFASKNAMDIEHMGEKVVEQLVEKGLVSRISDLYLLTAEDLATLDGFQEKSIQNLLKSIASTRKCPLSRLIMGLGIKYVGTETAELLAREVGDLDTLMHRTEEELCEIEGIGEKTAQAIYAFFQEKENRDEIKRLLAHGIRPQKMKAPLRHHAFAGKTFVLTGTLSHFSRSEATAQIKERGGHVAGSVSAKTDFVLVGEDPGSKYDKAKKLQIHLLSEEQFLKML